jgi:hypothetical protein
VCSRRRDRWSWGSGVGDDQLALGLVDVLLGNESLRDQYKGGGRIRARRLCRSGSDLNISYEAALLQYLFELHVCLH